MGPLDRTPSPFRRRSRSRSQPRRRSRPRSRSLRPMTCTHCTEALGLGAGAAVGRCGWDLYGRGGCVALAHLPGLHARARKHERPRHSFLMSVVLINHEYRLGDTRLNLRKAVVKKEKKCCASTILPEQPSSFKSASMHASMTGRWQ